MWSRKLYDTDKANQSLILSADLDFEVLTENPANEMPQGSPPSLPDSHFYAPKNAYAAGEVTLKGHHFFLPKRVSQMAASCSTRSGYLGAIFFVSVRFSARW